MTDMDARARAIAERLCEKWFDMGARASWCPKMVDEFAGALRAARAEGLEEAAQWIEDNFMLPGNAKVLADALRAQAQQAQGREGG